MKKENELQNELEAFLAAYETAANSCNFDKVSPFIADDATFWFTNGQSSGKQAIHQAFEDTWGSIKNEVYTISNVRWVAQGYDVASCSYDFKSDGFVDGQRQIYEGHGTNVFARVDGNWRIVHEHLGK